MLDPKSATNIRDSREDTFIRLLFQGLPLKESALQAGYSESFAVSNVYSKFNNPRFQDKIRQYAIANNSLFIPKVCNLYNKTLKVLEQEVEQGNIDNMGKSKHITTQILQIGKILSPDIHQNVINLVNIESMQTLIAGKLPPTGSSEEWPTNV